MPINLEEFLIEVASDTESSLVMGSITTDSHARIGVCYSYGSVCFYVVLAMISIPFFSCDT